MATPSVIAKLLSVGQDGLDDRARGQARILNLVCYVLAAICLLSGIAEIAEGMVLIGVVDVLLVGFFLVPVLLQHFKYHLAAKLLVLFVMDAAMLYGALALGRPAEMELMFLVPVALTFILIPDQEHARWRLAHLVAVLVPVVVLEGWGYDAVEPVSLTEGQMHAYRYVIKGFSFVMVWVVVRNITTHLYASQDHVTSLLDAAMQQADSLEDQVAERTHELEQQKLVSVEEREKAESANKTKSEFLANMSHEIRTPLNGITGLTAIALRSKTSPEIRDKLVKIGASAQALTRIVNDILDFSKIEADMLRVESIPFDLRDVVQNVASVICSDQTSDEIEFLISTDPDVPIKLIGDPLRLGQILTNLASNAVKFTPAGEVLVKIELLEESAARTKIQFTVRDTGIGISREQQDQLFRPFTQVDSTTSRVFGGTGLGLTISDRLVTMMGGQLRLESELEVGSTFSFLLELGTRRDEEGTRFQVPDNLLGLNALIVDDNATSRKILTTMLQSFRFSSTAVEGGEEAIEALVEASSTSPFQLILLDHRMPGIDGIETALRIEADARLSGQIPKIIMVTAFGHQAIRERAEAAGIGGFLEKPVQSSLLLDTIADVLGQGLSRRVTKGVEGCSKAVETDNLRGKHVLVAEDNKINQQVAREALEEAGVIVEIADNGEVAVEMIRESRFDAVLMDVQMPGIDGYEASRRIRSDRRFDSLPIIAMTAHSLSGDREKCLEAGMNDHLPKPVDFDELHAMLETWLVRDTEFSGPQARPGIAEELPDQLDGFDLPPAIKRMRGDRGLLRKLLIEFHRDYVDVAERIRRDLAKDDRASAGHLAHDVAGVSGNLGANDLREAALALERGVEKALAGPELLDQFEKALDIALTATAGLRPRS